MTQSGKPELEYVKEDLARGFTADPIPPIFEPQRHPRERLPVVAQVLFVGNDFNRIIREEKEGQFGLSINCLGLRKTRQVQIYAGLDEFQGVVYAEPYDPGKHPTDSDLLKVHKKHPIFRKASFASEPRTPKTVAKHGSSRKHDSVEKAVVEKGGDPSKKVGRVAEPDADPSLPIELKPQETSHGTYWGEPTEEHPRIDKSNLPIGV